MAVFWKDAPLHDGAVVLREGRIAAAGVVLPLTENFEYRSLSGDAPPRRNWYFRRYGCPCLVGQ